MQEVVAAVGQRHQLVAVHREPDIDLGLAVASLTQFVHTVLVQAPDERDVQVSQATGNRARWHVPGAQLRLDLGQRGSQAVQCLAALPDTRQQPVSLVDQPGGAR